MCINTALSIGSPVVSGLCKSEADKRKIAHMAGYQLFMEGNESGSSVQNRKMYTARENLMEYLVACADLKGHKNPVSSEITWLLSRISCLCPLARALGVSTHVQICVRVR